MSYPEAVRYLDSFINYEKKSGYPYKESFKLERIKGFLRLIGDPQNSLKCIHVAGTKGKGSVCAFCAYILKEAGYKVGLYTSPHLSEVKERIRVLEPRVTKSVRKPPRRGQGQCASLTEGDKVSAQASPKGTRSQRNEDFEGMISRQELESLVTRLEPEIEEYNNNSEYGPLSFFEVYTALAFIYFKEKKVDFAVLETGLGGRLDATNVVEPLVCAITPISFDHTEKLGNTLREIAGEKAGIIKKSHQVTKSPSHHSIVVSAPQEDEAMKVICDRCQKQDTTLYTIGKDINFERISFNNHSQDFNIRGVLGEHRNLKIRLLGEHQLVNAVLAVSLVDILIKFYQIKVKSGDIKRGFYNTIWPGRCEIISKNPLTVLDGAQNVASSRALKETIREAFRYRKLILILGISKDKDIKGICQEVYDLADEVVLTKSNNPRAAEPQNLSGYFNGKPVYTTHNVKEAQARAIRLAEKKDLVLITGSLFVVGEARELFSRI